MKFNILRNIFFAGIIACVTGIVQPALAADNLDTYRDLLQKKTYTINFESITPEPRQTERDKVQMRNKVEFAVSEISDFTNRPMKCIVVASGDNRYVEADAGTGLATCQLVRGDETFNFTKSVNSAGEVTYYGDKKGSVTAEATDRAYQDIYGQGMGTSDISRLMNAILPDENLPEDAPHYQKIGSGWLPDGKNYIDYRGDFPGSIEVIRYYFDQYALVKIASGIYTLNENGEVTDGRRCIVKITKFVPVADEAYLKLPEGLKDNTKRKKEGKK